MNESSVTTSHTQTYAVYDIHIKNKEFVENTKHYKITNDGMGIKYRSSVGEWLVRSLAVLGVDD